MPQRVAWRTHKHPGGAQVNTENDGPKRWIGKRTHPIGLNGQAIRDNAWTALGHGTLKQVNSHRIRLPSPMADYLAKDIETRNLLKKYAHTIQSALMLTNKTTYYAERDWVAPNSMQWGKQEHTSLHRGASGNDQACVEEEKLPHIKRCISESGAINVLKRFQ